MAPYTAGQGFVWVDECVAGLLLSCSCAASNIGAGDAQAGGAMSGLGLHETTMLGYMPLR